MAILRKNDVVKERPVIIVLYGTPGTGKTSLATTAESPMLIDTDRGFDRAVQRPDIVVTASQWEDIYNEEIIGKYVIENGVQVWKPGLISECKTIVVDTAKAMLDDYLSAYAVKMDYKLEKNSLKRYGLMGELFKQFVSVLRANESDIVFICHDKENTDGDITKHSPDCTGQSKDLLIRIADQVGYICKENNNRVIKFEPTDNRVGKNVAEIPDTWIPNYGTTEFETCMADIIKRVKKAIISKSDAQVKAKKDVDEARNKLAMVNDAEGANALIEVAHGLAKIHQKAFMNQMIKELSQKGIVFDKVTKKFVQNDKTAGSGNVA